MRRFLPLALLLTAPLAARAQEAATAVRDYTVGASGFAALPTAGLADRFGVGAGGAVRFGWGMGAVRYGVSVEAAALPKGSVRMLTEPDQNRPATVDLDRLELSFSTVGAAFSVERGLGRIGPAEPYLTASAGLARWRGVRGAYADSTSTLDLPELSQTGTSGRFSAGAGVLVPLGDRFSLTVGAEYAVTMGELWPTLSLGLDNVSTFQMVTPRLGLRYRIGG